MALIEKLMKDNLLQCPKWLPNNVAYLTIMGSQAYGTSMDDSDVDVYGFCVPPLKYLFPNTYGGEVEGFGRNKERFDQWQQHHVKTIDGKIEYDFTVYNISKYFHLCMDGNPNMIDSVFTPENCAIQTSAIGQLVRDNRHLFLSKKVMHTYRGYAYQQKNKMKTKEHHTNEKRRADIDAVGYSTKYAGHLVRLLLAAEQILNTCDYDIQRDREVIKSIRRREWSLEKIDEFFERKLLHLEDAYANSVLQHTPDENKIKELLMNCIEHHYGSITTAKIERQDHDILDDLESLLRKYNR